MNAGINGKRHGHKRLDDFDGEICKELTLYENAEEKYDQLSRMHNDLEAKYHALLHELHALREEH